MRFARGPSWSAQGPLGAPAVKALEDLLRTNVSDEKTLDSALRLLTLVVLQQRSVQVGIQATLQYLIDHDELRREGPARDEICVVPDPKDETGYPDPYTP